ncbi:hypothetical protein PHLGIDRAFT_464515 [Phlebiopsis gigantea 11061_1 CR5-6]|uniref:Uncharacterized protein n=1 Tax=Phlebiopsis gigantea (strain 11061_1 CR5-6) TaxID=745531 RepID=A0A0C3RX15_PHLG1|nr:hypothetical protein PHLGIDRAFT_464515 [Phlebiopsis gigantea 11061_1 CR5-6]
MATIGSPGAARGFASPRACTRGARKVHAASLHGLGARKGWLGRGAGCSEGAGAGASTTAGSYRRRWNERWPRRAGQAWEAAVRGTRRGCACMDAWSVMKRGLWEAGDTGGAGPHARGRRTSSFVETPQRRPTPVTRRRATHGWEDAAATACARAGAGMSPRLRCPLRMRVRRNSACTCPGRTRPSIGKGSRCGPTSAANLTFIAEGRPKASLGTIVIAHGRCTAGGSTARNRRAGADDAQRTRGWFLGAGGCGGGPARSTRGPSSKASSTGRYHEHPAIECVTGHVGDTLRRTGEDVARKCEGNWARHVARRVGAGRTAGGVLMSAARMGQAGTTAVAVIRNGAIKVLRGSGLDGVLC